jgi:Mrp family chromosome partitioning ATPase
MVAEPVHERSDLQALARIIRRRFWLVLISIAVGIGVALLISAGQPTQYQSTAVLLFRQVLLDIQLTGAPLELPSGDPAIESATDIGLVSSENVRAGAAQVLGPPYTADNLTNYVSVSAQGKSDLVGVQGTASSPSEAALIANTVAATYLRIANQQVVAEVTAAEDQVRSRIAARTLTPSQRSALRAALIKLSVLAAVGSDNVHLVQPAVPPTSPSSPKPKRNAILGGLAGLLIGLALVFGTEQFSTRLRSPEDVERESQLPLLATVPRSGFLRSPPKIGGERDSAEAETFRRLASKLRHLDGGPDIRSVLITSPGPGSGKTTVALHLAAAAAEALGTNVFLVEADLRQPRLSSLLGLPAGQGLSTVLQGDRQNGDAVRAIEFGGPPASQTADQVKGRRATIRGLDPIRLDQFLPRARPAVQSEPETVRRDQYAAHEKIAVLVAGPPSYAATRLLESDTMRELIRSWRSDYDLTVVDGPPPGFVADAIPLAKEVDAVIVVAGIGQDTSVGLRQLREELHRLGIKPLGVVANFGRRARNPYSSARRERGRR